MCWLDLKFESCRLHYHSILKYIHYMDEEGRALYFNYFYYKITCFSSVQIFHALTWRRKIATAAAEWRFPHPARVWRRRGRGSEALPHWRRWSSGGARVWGARAGERERSSGVKEVRKGWGGIYSRSEKLFARRFWTNLPLTLLLRLTCVTHELRSGDRVRSWVNR